jgi:glycolate oxidase
MDKLIEVDLDNMTITVEAGMVTNDLAHLVAEHGLFFAGYPMSVETCQIGGNIAENAGGGKAVKYGVTGRYVLGLELVTPTGDVVWLGGKLAKDVSGYDLKQLVIGSEGTLGIVTQAIIKLTAYPKAASDLLVLFESPRGDRPGAADLRQGIVPTGIEFMDRLSFQTSCQYLNETLPYEDAGAMLLIEVDGNDPAAVEADLLAIGDLCEKHGALEVYVAEDRNAVERVWSVRRNIAEAFKVASPVQSLEDIVVPVARIPDVIPSSSGWAPPTACRSPATATPATATCTPRWSRTRRWITTPG